MQVFVANPNKSRQVIDILSSNRDKLLKYLSDFHSDKGDLDCHDAGSPVPKPLFTPMQRMTSSGMRRLR